MLLRSLLANRNNFGNNDKCETREFCSDLTSDSEKICVCFFLLSLNIAFQIKAFIQMLDWSLLPNCAVWLSNTFKDLYRNQTSKQNSSIFKDFKRLYELWI